jgi:UDP-N-acetylmuramate: L-alanyl-gamma-D-glutamyl-meso-diaminopimelate ligase
MGVARRMEVVFPGPPTVIDDFAHHPTAVAASLATVRRHYPGRPVLAVFEPRSATSRRKIFAQEYERVFGTADAVWLLPATRLESIPADERIDVPAIAQGLVRSGVKARVGTGNPEDLASFARTMKDPVIIVMTSGPSRELIEPLAALLR